MNRPDEQHILHFIQGQASEQELQEILTWIEASEDNARELFQQEAFAHRLHALTTTDAQTEQAMRRVMSTSHQSSTRTMWPISSMLKYAAVLVIVLMLGGGLIYKIGNHSAEPTMLIAQAVDSPREICLMDGSRVWLNQGARLRYPEAFDGKTRQVQLEGEGYFEVAKDAKHPFIVSTTQMTVRVLGTKFNFKSYPNNNINEVSLIEGSVGVRGSYDRDMVVLLPGQKAKIDPESGRLQVSETDACLEAVWHDGMIPFENANIEKIADALEQIYGVKMIVSKNIDRGGTYSGCIQRKADIAEVLQSLRQVIPFRYQKKGNTVILSQP